MMEQETILFVDDEKNILKTLQRLFMDEPYRLLFANGGREGLDILRNGERPTVIVSDLRMPSMDGVEFLLEAKKMVPESVRMVLTGYADISAAIDAINLGDVSRYLMKPWNDDDLKLAVREAVSRANLERMNRELTAQLAERNRLLEELNEELEQRVEKRTRKLRSAFEKNMALTRALRRKVKELEGRDRLQNHLLTLHPTEETLQEIVEIMTQAMDAESGALFLSPLTAVPAVSFLCPGCSAPPPETLIPSPDVFRQIDASSLPRRITIQSSAEGQPGFTRLVAPITWRGELLGAVTLVRPSPAFDEEDIRAATAFCELAALALRDARINSEISSFGVNLDDILDQS